MFAVEVCNLPETGGSMFVTIAGLFVLVAGVIVTRWVRQSAGRLSVVVAPLVLLGGFVLAPQVVDPCAPATTVPSATTTTTVAATTTTVASATTTTTVAATTTTVAATTTTVAATTTTVASACASGDSCAVGDTGPGGGIVFYVDLTKQPGSRYLEAAPVGAEVIRTWATGGNQTLVVTGADGTVIGTGEQNTADIVAQSGNLAATSAAVYCSELISGGQSDWFLPSKDELNLMYTNLHNVSPRLGGFSVASYWSSSEYNNGAAWGQIFFNVPQYESPKVSGGYRVRPVRAF